jgi:DNA-binding transcriptional MerR regulator
MLIVKARAGVKIVELLMRNALPNKKFFNGNEIASLLLIQPHEIRSWESEFPQIRSLKTAKGQRIYRYEDVVLFASIKHLLKEKKLTIAGAQRVLAESDEHSLMGEDDKGMMAGLPHPLPSFEHEVVLQEASRMLSEDDDEFDDRSHQLYQQCAHDIPNTEVIAEPHHLSEMIHDGIISKQQEDQRQDRISKRDYDKALATLLASKGSLHEVLRMLEKYPATSFFNDVPVA